MKRKVSEELFNLIKGYYNGKRRSTNLDPIRWGDFEENQRQDMRLRNLDQVELHETSKPEVLNLNPKEYSHK